MIQTSDEQLISRYIKGDEESLEFLVKRYLPLIFGLVRKYTGNKDDASDITQETFVKAWRNIRRFDRTKNFRAWIFTIARRTAIDWLKKKNALPFSVIENETGGNFAESLVGESPSILEQMSSKEDFIKFALAIENLPAGHANIIRLHVDDGLNFREISEFLKEPINTVKSRYRRGISLLKKKFL